MVKLARLSLSVAHRVTVRDVAVKYYRGEADETYLGDMRFEIGVLSLLRHPCIVRCFGASIGQRAGEESFIVMERGRDFGAWLRGLEGPLGQEDLLDFSLDILSAVEHLHALLIVHRDLKASNLLYVPSSVSAGRHQLKLCDFGSARETARQMQWTRGVGTMAWMAPELFRGKPVPCEKVDIYAFGLIFWCMDAQGAEPYAELKADLPLKVAGGVRPVLSGRVSRPVRDRIKMAWHNDPAKRPDAQSLRNSFIEFKNGL